MIAIRLSQSPGWTLTGQAAEPAGRTRRGAQPTPPPDPFATALQETGKLEIVHTGVLSPDTRRGAEPGRRSRRPRSRSRSRRDPCPDGPARLRRHRLPILLRRSRTPLPPRRPRLHHQDDPLLRHRLHRNRTVRRASRLRHLHHPHRPPQNHRQARRPRLARPHPPLGNRRLETGPAPRRLENRLPHRPLVQSPPRSRRFLPPQRPTPPNPTSFLFTVLSPTPSAPSKNSPPPPAPAEKLSSIPSPPSMAIASSPSTTSP